MNNKILLIEDDLDLGEQTAYYLRSSGFDITWASSATEALSSLDKGEFDLMLVDIQMPDMDGFELVERVLVDFPHQRFVFLTARDNKESKINGLKLGGEDYVTKPFDVEELYWRITNILQRKTGVEQENVQLGDITLNMLRMEINIGKSEAITLTEREFVIWKYFLTHANVILRREQILTSLWGKNDYFLGRSLDVYITRMRKLLQHSELVNLNTIFKVGFLLEHR